MDIEYKLASYVMILVTIYNNINYKLMMLYNKLNYCLRKYCVAPKKIL